MGTKMQNKWFSYIKIHEEDSYIKTSGISFHEFYSGIKVKPQNLLILNGYPRMSESVFDPVNWLEYVPAGNMAQYVKSDVHGYGDFSWVDFAEVDSLKNIAQQELAELLYFAHTWKPLSSFYFSSLHNRYAYIAHDDDWAVRIYMDDTESYKQVIEYKILKELKGRKRSIAPIPEEIMEQLYSMFCKGAVLDFENSYLTGVRVYPMGEIDNMDGIHDKLDRLRCHLQGTGLDYNTNSKKWSLY